MSKPRRATSKNNAGNTMAEISSAISALNMYPEPIEPQQHFHLSDSDDYEPCLWLSSTDKGAAHAVEHLTAALEYAAEAWSDINKLEFKIKILEAEIKQLKKEK